VKLLEKVGKLLEENLFLIENIDATIIAQAPKMRPYIDTMRQNIADALGLDLSQVSVKATTEEGLGFTGSGEGISAQAICMLTSPAELYDRDVAVTGGCAGCGGCPKAGGM
jgi:2-C-methyl-D-erythritol 2,4-cyclodiphosphate synthase